MFRKIVSYLAYSPAMLWKLSELDKKNKKDLRDTNWSILLLAVLIVMLLILWVGQPKQTNTTKSYNETERRSSLISQPDGLNTKIELERHTHKIKQSQAIGFVLSVTNNTNEIFSGDLLIDLSQSALYLTILHVNSNNISIKNKLGRWSLDNLAPGETAQTTLNFQSINNFGSWLNNKNDRCVVNISFGNQLNIPVECSGLKLAQIELSDMGIKKPYYALIVIVLLVILTVKIIFRTELRLSVKETQLIRKEINSGKFLL